jgi:pimeloyl-ACP methyl ester carboxylesterase
MKSMTEEYANDVSFAQIDGANHWLPEENPTQFVSRIKHFLGRNTNGARKLEN